MRQKLDSWPIHPSLKTEFDPPPDLSPKSKMGRNDNCWCGSGIKWKKCHRDRHLQKEVPIGKLLNEMQENFKKKMCLHPEASPSTCSNTISKAHTIQRAGGLSAIAENGHVITGKKGFENIFKNDGRIVPGPIGIGNASTFMGFCSFHDNKLFEPIENNSFNLNNETAFLLSFRSISYEHYMKQHSINGYDAMRNMDKGKNFETQIHIQQNLHYLLLGAKRAMRDMEKWKSKYDHIYFSKNYLSMPHYAVEFNGILPFVSCGVFLS